MNLCGQKSVNRHGRFRDSDLLRHVFEAAVRACMDAGLVKGEGFAVDASVMEADASRYHGKAPDEIDWSTPERQTRAVAEVLTSTGYLECWHRNQGAIDMATARPNATLIASLVLATCLLVVEYAVADDGACGLEIGTWAAPKEACQYAGRPDEAAKRFGEDSLLEWNLGYYRFQGANCIIFSDKLAAKRCTLRVECSHQGTHYMGEWDIEVETTHQFRFGTRPDSPIYYHCTADAAPR